MYTIKTKVRRNFLQFFHKLAILPFNFSKIFTRTSMLICYVKSYLLTCLKKIQVYLTFTFQKKQPGSDINPKVVLLINYIYFIQILLTLCMTSYKIKSFVPVFVIIFDYITANELESLIFSTKKVKKLTFFYLTKYLAKNLIHFKFQTTV